MRISQEHDRLEKQLVSIQREGDNWKSRCIQMESQLKEGESLRIKISEGERDKGRIRELEQIISQLQREREEFGFRIKEYENRLIVIQ